MKNNCPILAILMILLVQGSTALAQQFQVRRFRILPNDISAYIQPVKDLNGEACALIKVVGDADFVFSTPLGIVKQKHEVGEIWIYLPNGSRQITIKHPRWGVMRDFAFHQKLESRMTYELVITPSVTAHVAPFMPPLPQTHARPDTLIRMPAALEPYPQSPVRRPREPWHRIIMTQTGLGYGQPTFGIRLALMRRHGAYVAVLTDLHSMPPTEGQCLRDGALPQSNIYPYYSGKKKEQQYGITAGGIHRLFSELCLYEGIGYGKRSVAWQTADGKYLQNEHYTMRTVCAEIGLLWRFRRCITSAGIHTIGARCWQGTVGIGYHF